MNILEPSSFRVENGLPSFQVSELDPLRWLRHGFLTRKGGVSPPPFDSLNISLSKGDQAEHVSENKQRIARVFGFHTENLVLLNQMHQDRILVLKESLPVLPSLLEYDASITNIPGTFLGIKTADCLPIMIIDFKKRVIAAIHAGRQGTALRITTQVLRLMKAEFGCSTRDLLVALGPSIGACCYEIDERVFKSEWEPFATPTGPGRWKVDLAQINIAHIKSEGIDEAQLFWVNLCTRCHRDLFFSHRKEIRTGRQLSFIGMI
jgi:YfiH family protein